MTANFSWENTAQEYIAVYRSLLQTNGYSKAEKIKPRLLQRERTRMVNEATVS
jgi:hypothetical protein